MDSEEPVRKAAREATRSFSPVQKATRSTRGAILFFATLVFVAAQCGQRVCPQQEVPLEYQVKASFLYKFPQLVEWPAEVFANANTDLVIGIVGQDPFGGELERAIGTPLRGRKITVRRLQWDQKLRSCQVVFISRSERKHLRAILASLEGENVLTVSELDGFCSSGGIIEFVFEENRVRFDINREAAEHSGLKISARLLAVARKVYG